MVQSHPTLTEAGQEPKSEKGLQCCLLSDTRFSVFSESIIEADAA